MDFGRAIRIARARLGKQQRDLAQATGLDASYVSLLESGKRKPSEEVLENIAAALGVPLPLFRLLAAEEADLKMWDEPAVNSLSMRLLELLTEADDPDE